MRERASASLCACALVTMGARCITACTCSVDALSAVGLDKNVWAGALIHTHMQDMDEPAPAPERKAPDDKAITEVTPSPNFELESYISNYSGRCDLRACCAALHLGTG